MTLGKVLILAKRYGRSSVFQGWQTAQGGVNTEWCGEGGVAGDEPKKVKYSQLLRSGELG